MANESSSKHRLVATVGVHRLTIEGHSLASRTGTIITSKPFWVGGYEWFIRYYPDGSANSGGQHASVFLYISNAGEGEVTALYSFSCLEGHASPTVEDKDKSSFVRNFSSKNRGWGTDKFFKKDDLASPGCLTNDCLVIKCTVEVITTNHLTNDDEDSTAVVVPPSDLTQQLGRLLESGDATDITIQVGAQQSFKAHRCVLAARSPVFCAMLCGSMMESKANTICVPDMEANVFRVLLHYLYHDDVPVFGKDVCTHDVLAAADRYGMDRLKVICESMLSKTIDVSTVCSTLDFADRHSCRELKNCCLAYILKDRERLKAIVKTEDFKQLGQTCAHLAYELLVKSLDD